MQGRRWYAGAVVAIVVVLAGVTSTGTAGGAAAPDVPTTPAAAARADLALLAHIPDAVRPSCLFIDTSYNYDAPGGHYFANLKCHPDSATTIEYIQYPTAAEMTDEFSRFTTFSGKQCVARSPYTVGGQQLGEWICLLDSSTGNAEIYWTFDPMNVLALLERTDNDATAARATWNDDAGPDRGAHDVPDFVTRSASQKGGRMLLAEIPHAAKNKCKATDLSVPANLLDGPSPAPGFWLDAEVVCKNGGMPTIATYRHYRDADAYGFAYDPTTYLAYAEPDDAACPNGYESGWNVNGEEVGRIACYRLGAPPDAEAHLLWTYDPQQIVGEALAARQKSAQALYDWWEKSAGPVE